MLAQNLAPEIRKFYRLDQPEIYEVGLRLNDLMIIEPMRGGTKKINLSRTEVRIESTQEHEIKVQLPKLEIPSSLGREFSLELKLLPLEDGQVLGNGSRFMLKTNNGRPFKLNGQYCYEALIQRGDHVRLDYTHIKFLEKIDLEKVTNHHDKIKEEFLPIYKKGINILIEGETGTGKSHLAKIIHQVSERTGKFVHLNLASFSKELIESELFGHVKGAFTGAINFKLGAILEAHQGTLFLDEIDSLPLELQTKLLLFLDSKKIRPVGSQKEEEANVRLIFASGQNLSQLCDKQKFRRDLYFRICSGHYQKLEPLRENKLKIRQLVNKFCEKNNLNISLNLLKHYEGLNWPGNVRQLLGHLELKKLTSNCQFLEFDHYDQKLENSRFVMSEHEEASLEAIKVSYAKKIYTQTDSNLRKTATILEISENTLRKLLA